MRSEDLELLLAPGKVEAIVRKGRTPVRIGTISGEHGKQQPHYQLPPLGYDPKAIKSVRMNLGGVYSFFTNTGVTEIGPTYVLTEEQAQEVEDRIAVVQAKIQLEKDGELT